MTIDILIALLIGMFIGTNFGFIIAGIFGGTDEDIELADTVIEAEGREE